MSAVAPSFTCSDKGLIVETLSAAAFASSSCEEAAPLTSFFVSSTRVLAVRRTSSRWSANESPSPTESKTIMSLMWCDVKLLENK